MSITPYDPAKYGNVGMEDIEAGDLIIPRLQIDHKKNVFRNNLTKEEFPQLTVVLLGLVKQRIMWDRKVEEGDRPQCKSPDFDSGYPNVREDAPRRIQFPWHESNFNKEDHVQADGTIQLPCASCNFKEWRKDPNDGSNISPPCNEQHTYPLEYSADGGETWVTALVTFQRTGIKPSKQYMSSFAQSNLPFFTSYTDLSLQHLQRGQTDYSVPVFKLGGPTDQAKWGEYAEKYMQIRTFARAAPRQNTDDAATEPSSNVNTAPSPTVQSAPTQPVQTPTAQPAQPQPAQPAPAQPAPAYVVPDDDLPF